MAKYILENEYCEECGNNLELNTEAEQKSNFDFYAFDGDEAICLECGELHIVTVIENKCAYITIA